MKILFVWRKIDGVSGGVERMSAAMMNDLIQRGHEVSFLSWDHEDAVSYYTFDPKINWYKLGIGDPNQKGNWKTRFKRMKKVREIVKKDNPNAIFCFESGVFFSTKMFLTGFNIPIVSAERNAPSRHEHSSNPKKRYSVYAMLTLADKITVQFERYKEGYPAFLRKKMVAINNPVVQTTDKAEPAGKEKEPKILLTVSRLAYQKNITTLISAFSDIKDHFPDWVLKIAGDGEETAERQKQINQLKAENQIQLLGAVSDVSSLYTSSHLFCLPSRYEGFPNAMAEALAHGLPAIGYAECCGVRDLIENNHTGLLASGNGNVKSLSDSLTTLMKDHDKREAMGKKAKDSMVQYAPEKIFDQWEDFFKDIIKN